MLLGTLLPTAAHATPVTWMLGFEVLGTTEREEGACAGFASDDSLDWTFTWEPGAPGHCNPDIASCSWYDIATRIEHNDETLFDGESWVEIDANEYYNSFVAQVEEFPTSAGLLAGRLILDDYSLTVLTDTSLPAVLPAWDFGVRAAILYDHGATCQVEASLVSVTGGPACTDSDADGSCDADDLCAGDDSAGDTDADGVCDASDVCPLDADPEQADADADQIGDACEADGDADGVVDDLDNCPTAANADQADSEMDGVGDVCDADDDNDGYADADDACPLVPDDQADADGDGLGDACDADADADGVPNGDDLCPATPMDVPHGTDGCSGAQYVRRVAGEACDWSNRGQYVRAVAAAADDARDRGLLTDTERASIVRTSARTDTTCP